MEEQPDYRPQVQGTWDRAGMGWLEGLKVEGFDLGVQGSGLGGTRLKVKMLRIHRVGG